MLKETVEQLDREIQKKRYQETSEKTDAMISLLVGMVDGVSDIKPSIEESTNKYTESILKLADEIKALKIETPKVEVTVPDVIVPEIKIPKIDTPIIPEIKIPEIVIPEIKLPTINVPEPKVTVNIPEIRIPNIEVPKIEMPESMNIMGDVGLRDIDRKNPVPVLQVDEAGNPIVMSAGGGGAGRFIKGEVSINPAGNAVTIDDGANVDAFARLRVSNPQTLFDSKNIFDDDGIAAGLENQPLFYDNRETDGGGTSTTFDVNHAAQTLAVANLTTGTRVRQTKMRFNYQPGKSQLVLMTFNINGQSSGITKREGIFDDRDGIFLEVSDDIYLVKRSYASGTAVDTKVKQSSWSVDPFDGTGVSKKKLDVTKTQILIIDFEWLGVGRVRAGFVIDGKIYYAHEFQHANIETVVYMTTPNLPLRSEITNDGTGGVATLSQICSSVISEGGSNDLGVIRYASTAGTHVDADVENTVYAVLGVKLKSNYIGATVKMLTTALQLQSATAKCEWLLKLDPVVAGTFTYNNQTNSAVAIARGATANTVTGGLDITGGFIESGGVAGGAAGSTERGIDTALVLGSDIQGTTQAIVLCVRPIAGSTNVDVEGSLTWRELL